jgi:alkylation response protein AidB-like acyl-CoA dehydrogenase
VEEVARRAAIVPLVEAIACGIALERGAQVSRSEPRASEAQRTGAATDALVAGLLSGGVVPVPAVLEASDDFARVSLEFAGGRVRGEKRFVDYGEFATHHLVSVRDRGELALCLVDARAREVEARPLRTIGRTPSATVRYDGVPAERVAGADAAEALLQLGRAFAALQCVGSAAQALDLTVAYASAREAFGRPIGSFQAVKHHAANMSIKVAASRHLAFEALGALDRGDATRAQVALAKASASRMVPEVTILAHQIHGGNGIIEENDLYFTTLRGKERSLAWGTVDECLAEVAAGVHELVDWLG